ncbi:MAG TPA: SH3 domain-containing protein [Anaerolineales bacterium]|nr:SH3 domain-containing protein [Anaerolineales bacterium]
MRKFWASLILIATILTCNLPPREQVPPPEDVQTAAALTVEALLIASFTPTVQQGILATSPSPISTVAHTMIPTITPTYSTPMLIVRAPTNCRTGPGEAYEIVYTYLAGKRLEIIGRYDSDNYWLVKSTESPSGECWLWGEYVEVSGSYWVVSSVTPPPTATLAPPQAPSIKKWEFFCSAGQMTITINWTDRATNEEGYRILRNGEAIAELPPNSTTFTETIALLSGEQATYIVQVYNVTDAVNSVPMSLTC